MPSALPAFSSPKHAAAGFTLLEVIVAVFIAALCLGALSQLFATGVRSADTSSRFARAATVAETLLASAGAESPLEDGMISGVTDDGQLEWSLAISEELVDGADGVVQPPYLLKRLIARVVLVDQDARNTGGNERMVVLTSLRVMPRPEAGL